MSGELTELHFYTVTQATVLGLLYSSQEVCTKRALKLGARR